MAKENDKNKKTTQKNTKRNVNERLLAVIDIGSNSVRLVVFQGLHRNPHVLFNERVLCGLGRDVDRTGAMDEKAVENAHATLMRFARLCREMKVDETEVVATSAVRDSTNGKDFVKRVREDCGFSVRVLNGDKEALYSGLGVLSGMPRADGIAGDLGGGSLELMRIEDGQIHERVSLPIGPVRLMGSGERSDGAISRDIDKALSSVDWLAAGKDKKFYMVGGTWRTMARVHMEQVGWPMPELHQYAVGTRDMKAFAQALLPLDKVELNQLTDVPKRRLEVLPLGARILTKVLNRVKPREVVTSGQGLREGLLYKRFKKHMRETDPFLAACKELADTTGRFPEHASKLMQWTSALFPDEDKNERRLRYAICLLSDVSWKAHPDFRARDAFNKMFYIRYGGAMHQEKAFVAYALYILYGGKVDDDDARRAGKLLNLNDMLLARRIGLALRLGQRLTGGTAKPLDYTYVSVTDSRVCLHVPKKKADIAGTIVRQRLDSLAKAMNLEGKVVKFKGKTPKHEKLPTDIAKLVAAQV